MSKRKCPSCAEAIQTEAVKCKHCGAAVPALPKRKGSTAAAIFTLAVLLWVAGKIFGGSSSGSGSSTPEKATTSTGLSDFDVEVESRGAAISLVKSSLKVPSTAEIETKMLFNSGGRAIVLVQADAENSFGAKLRQFYCVAVEITAADRSGWNFPKHAIKECTTWPSREVIDRLKKSNGWK